MPNWGELLEAGNLDNMRRKYLDVFHQYTGRNIIAYYSSFIQKPRIEEANINENDKNAFMQAVCGLDRRQGLDLILHTPGGDLAATESIVYYLKKMFGTDIRVFVPQIAMSAGTMIALSSREIVMGKQSNLGPIDPQYGGVSCAGILEEFETAKDEVSKDPRSAAIWEPIISQYHPTFIGDCEKAIHWADSMVEQWLIENMFRNVEGGEKKKEEKARKVLDTLSSHNKTYSHSRHIHIDELKKLGLNVVALEGLDDRAIDDCKDLQDCLLTLHHTYMQSLSSSDAIKIVENHQGNAMIVSKRRK